ncbi:WD40 repeat domain-containing protein [Colwellia psychrerythraea]|uniref:WD-40 repeat-containing protein n=1 Tax=Colwellia psychrerythraea TaxID=28229 RepID=A0A099KV49_COLPS|nr:lipoprotein [Colwellia psychrerythraea]KGJ94446.1 WD-40 repeat-containing protein [Colwellia psychrerythraea]
MVKVVMLITAISVLNLLGCSQQDVHTGSSELALNHSDNIITASALSKDGQFNLVADGKTVCLWSISQTESPVHCLMGNDAQFIELLDISENNQFYLVSNQVSVRLYSMQSNKRIGEWQVANNIINDMDISENGSKILLGFRSGKASVIDVKRNQVSTFDKHRLDINSVSLSEDGAIAFTGSSDKKARLWHTTSGENIQEFSHGSRVNHVKISGDAKVAFTLDAIKDRTFWEVSTGKVLAELDTKLRFFEFNDSLFSVDNSLFLTGSPKQVIKLWRVSDGALVAEWQSEMTRGRSSVLSVAYLDHDKIVTINSDGLFEQWQLPNHSE